MPRWNDRLLVPPPICTFQYHRTKTDIGSIQEVQKAVGNLLRILKSENPLWTELSTLSRLIYKYNCPFRKQKLLQAFKKVERCLKRFKEMPVISCLSELLQDLPKPEVLRGDEEFYLPSKQLMQYVLVRMMGVTYLLHQIEEACFEAYNRTAEFLSLGVFVPQMVVFIGLVSRIWAMCKTTRKCVMECFASLRPVEVWLKASAVEWLDAGDTIPDDLNDWLSDTTSIQSNISDGLESGDQMDRIFKKYKTPELTGVDDETTGDLPDRGLQWDGDGDISSTVATSLTTPDDVNIMIDTEDIGQPVQRKNRSSREGTTSNLSDISVAMEDVNMETDSEDVPRKNSLSAETASTKSMDTSQLKLEIKGCVKFKRLLEMSKEVLNHEKAEALPGGYRSHIANELQQLHDKDKNCKDKGQRKVIRKEGKVLLKRCLVRMEKSKRAKRNTRPNLVSKEIEELQRDDDADHGLTRIISAAGKTVEALASSSSAKKETGVISNALPEAVTEPVQSTNAPDVWTPMPKAVLSSINRPTRYLHCEDADRFTRLVEGCFKLNGLIQIYENILKFKNVSAGNDRSQTTQKLHKLYGKYKTCNNKITKKNLVMAGKKTLHRYLSRITINETTKRRTPRDRRQNKNLDLPQGGSTGQGQSFVTPLFNRKGKKALKKANKTSDGGNWKCITKGDHRILIPPHQSLEEYTNRMCENSKSLRRFYNKLVVCQGKFRTKYHWYRVKGKRLLQLHHICQEGIKFLDKLRHNNKKQNVITAQRKQLSLNIMTLLRIKQTQGKRLISDGKTSKSNQAKKVSKTGRRVVTAGHKTGETNQQPKNVLETDVKTIKAKESKKVLKSGIKATQPQKSKKVLKADRKTIKPKQSKKVLKANCKTNKPKQSNKVIKAGHKTTKPKQSNKVIKAGHKTNKPKQSNKVIKAGHKTNKPKQSKKVLKADCKPIKAKQTKKVSKSDHKTTKHRKSKSGSKPQKS